ncbi:hypothetical protein CPB83DRAFT_243461 [Crepidotus variabilis]|uniref:Uncharacterized protein n=1 Tax=Crepidotus variabilis TaxID=179855 RepID=A0A9P6JRN4_9AGAR|nr:hypothetical protein CPB83DRAFT_243461 [Crepidotus variabilis]
MSVACSGGTAFAGIGSILPIYLSLFHITLRRTTVQQMAITSVVVGCEPGAYATYANFSDRSVYVCRNMMDARVQYDSATKKISAFTGTCVTETVAPSVKWVGLSSNWLSVPSLCSVLLKKATSQSNGSVK